MYTQIKYNKPTKKFKLLYYKIRKLTEILSTKKKKKRKL